MFPTKPEDQIIATYVLDSRLRIALSEGRDRDQVIYRYDEKDYVLYRGKVTRVPVLTRGGRPMPAKVRDRVTAFVHEDADLGETYERIMTIGTADGVVVISEIPHGVLLPLGLDRAGRHDLVTAFLVPSEFKYVAFAEVKAIKTLGHTGRSPYDQEYVLISVSEGESNSNWVTPADIRRRLKFFEKHGSGYSPGLPEPRSETWLIKASRPYPDSPPEGGVYAFRGEGLKIADSDLTAMGTYSVRDDVLTLEPKGLRSPNVVSLSNPRWTKPIQVDLRKFAGMGDHPGR